jgi:hypothetical protein
MHELTNEKTTWGEIVQLTLMRILLKLFVDLNAVRIKAERKKKRIGYCRVCNSGNVLTTPRPAVPKSNVFLPICDDCWRQVLTLPEPRTWSAFSKLRKNFN